MGGALPELHLPLPGTEPNAFIVICTAAEPDDELYIDLGISAQSMLLQAVEIGLNGLCIRAFDREALKLSLALRNFDDEVITRELESRSVNFKLLEKEIPRYNEQRQQRRMMK